MPGTLPGGGNLLRGIVEGTMTLRAVADVFSADARNELRNLLGPKAQVVIPRLEHRMKTWRKEAWRKVVSPIGDPAMLRLTSQLRKLVRAINGTPASARTQFGDPWQGENDWDCLVAIRDAAEVILQRLDERIGGSRLRGRPRDYRRQWIANTVAWDLRVGGCRVTSSRGGTFARVLDTVLTEIDGDSPLDSFRLISRAVRDINKLTPDEMRPASPGELLAGIR